MSEYREQLLNEAIRKRRQQIKRAEAINLVQTFIVDQRKDGSIFEVKTKDGKVFRNPSRAELVKDILTVNGYDCG